MKIIDLSQVVEGDVFALSADPEHWLVAMEPPCSVRGATLLVQSALFGHEQNPCAWPIHVIGGASTPVWLRPDPDPATTRAYPVDRQGMLDLTDSIGDCP